MDHTAECLKAQDDATRAGAEYDRRWPGHCRSCNGWGGRSYRYDPSPSGVALSPGWMEDFEPCPDCAEKGLCPRCMKATMPEDGGEGPCPACGWTPKDGRPWIPECICWPGEESWEDECDRLEEEDTGKRMA